MLFSLEPQILVLLAFSLVFALSFHEFAHAYVADRFGDPTARMAGRFLTLFILINFNLCLFNLIPLGPLDGSYVLSGFLRRELKWKYEEWNARFGYQALLGLVLVSVVIPGFSFFSWISQISRGMLRFVIG